MSILKQVLFEMKGLQLPEGKFTVNKNGFNNYLQVEGTLPDGRKVKLNRGSCVDCVNYVIADKDSEDYRGGEMFKADGKLAKEILSTIQKYK